MMRHISLDLMLYHACGRPRLSQTQPFLFRHYDEITISSWGFTNSCSFSDSEDRFWIFFLHFKRVNGIYLCRSLLKTAGSWLSPQAETLYITHYKIRMCTSCWNCTNLCFCLPVWENKQCVSFVSPPCLIPVSSVQLAHQHCPRHPSKSSVSGHWPAEEPSPSTPCSSPREPKQPSRWQGACGVNAHTQKHCAPI